MASPVWNAAATMQYVRTARAQNSSMGGGVGQAAGSHWHTVRFLEEGAFVLFPDQSLPATCMAGTLQTKMCPKLRSPGLVPLKCGQPRGGCTGSESWGYGQKQAFCLQATGLSSVLNSRIFDASALQL